MLQHIVVRVPVLFALLLLTGLTSWAQSAGTKPIYPITFKPGAKPQLSRVRSRRQRQDALT